MTEAWLKEVALSGLGDTETFEATYDICRALLDRGVPGDFCECGVYAGAHPAIMAKAILDYYEEDLINNGYPIYVPSRRVHLFDSFEGIPKGGPEDHELQHKPAGESACSMEQVKANLKRWGLPEELFVFHKGLFRDTVYKAFNSSQIVHPNDAWKIAFLRLDGDLYDSTKVCLDYLLPLVSRGGWVCVDDFNLSGCRKAVLEATIPAPLYWRIPTK